MKADDPEKPELGVRLVTAYKFTKAALQLLLSTIILTLVALKQTGGFHASLLALREHAEVLTSVWSTRVADFMVTASTPRHLLLLGSALLFDGALSLTEGVALRRGLTWAPWLIVVAGGTPLPWELYELTKHHDLGRLLLLAVNLAIVAYFVRKLRRERS